MCRAYTSQLDFSCLYIQVRSVIKDSYTQLSPEPCHILPMTSKLVPPNLGEVMVIRKVSPNITICSAPFNRFGHFKVGGRGTIGNMAL